MSSHPRKQISRRCKLARRTVRGEKLEDRQLLAGDVCFPLTAAEPLRFQDVNPTAVYGPLQVVETELGESESATSNAGLAVPIVSIFPASGNEGNSLSPAEVATASSMTANTLSFTVSLNEPAPGPVTVEVSTSDGTAKGLVVERIAAGFSRPVYATAPLSDPTRLFVIEQRTGIRIINLVTGTTNPTPFLTIPDLNQNNNEGGLLGLAFHPDYATNGRFFVNMTNNRQPFGDNIGDTFIREYRVSPTNPDVAIPTPVQTILTLEQPFGNHNGGWLDFGPDGYLYIALGDGGSSNDPGNRSQNLDSLLGKMLRIDVNGDDFPANAGRNYAIPPSNPFVGIAGADEIWAYGLRNHYRNSFDRETGDLYIADVGQNRREEINVQPSGSTGGENYGWRLREGMIQNPAPGVGGAKPAGAIDPIYDYNHGEGDFQGRSVTGGYVYRGPIEDLQGQYFFADYINSRIWGLRYNGDAPLSHDDTNYDGFTDFSELLQPDVGAISIVTSFGEDAVGNLYIVDFGDFGTSGYLPGSGEVFVIRNGADFVSRTETITFNTGEQTKTFMVPIVYDILQESDETFQVNLGTVSGATIGNGTATGTIINDDGLPVVSDIVIDNDTAQRSMIRSVTVTFDGVVDLPDSAFTLFNTGTIAAPTNTEVTNLIVHRQVVGLQTIATITFGSGASVVNRAAGNSLADGNYQLKLNGATILGEQPTDQFFRLYGDADGDGFADFNDFASAFLPSFGASPTSAAYKEFMDFDGDNDVDFNDFALGFLPNFGKSR